MNVTEHQGWLIESRSYKSDGSRWCPRALVSVFEGGRFYMHDVLALLSVTFDTARDSDDYAVKMAKTWIEDDIRKHTPLSGRVSALSGQHIGLRGHDEVVPVEAVNLVSPPGHGDTPPLGEEGGMVTLRLGEGADPVSESQRVDETREVEDALEPGDPVALQQLPA